MTDENNLLLSISLYYNSKKIKKEYQVQKSILSSHITNLCYQ